MAKITEVEVIHLAMPADKTWFESGFDETLVVRLTGNHPKNAILVGVKAVIAELKARNEPDGQTGADANGEAEDIDGGESLVPGDVAPCGLEIAAEHGVGFDLPDSGQKGAVFTGLC